MLAEDEMCAALFSGPSWNPGPPSEQGAAYRRSAAGQPLSHGP